MRHLKKSVGSNIKYYIIIIATAFIAYWPLTLNVFSLKNDATTYFLPWRYHISEAIQNGYFPFWSPYLYTGLPLHSDIQSGVWNPVVFIVSLFTSYNMSVLQWETLLYIIVAGIGFFKMCRFFSLHKRVCLLLSISYMCCGFIIDSGAFIPWIASSAYIPFTFLYFLRTIQNPASLNTLKLALSTSLLFLAGYPSFFIFTSYILLFSCIAHVIICIKKKKTNYVFRFLKHLASALFCTLVICSPALISYAEFLPYYNRGHGVSLQMSQTNPFAFGNIVSYLFPEASYKLNTQNDISSRNAYVGILPVLFIFLSLRIKYGLHQQIIFGITILCFLFSLGGATPVHKLFYHILPLTNTFRHPATIRLFTSMGLLLLGGFGLEHYVNAKVFSPLRKIAVATIVLLLLFILYVLFFDGGFHDLKRVSSLNLTTSFIKGFLDSSSFFDWLFIAGFVQLLFLFLILLIKNRDFLFYAGSANVVVMCFLSMPFTMISQHKAKEVNAFVNSFPKNFPPDLAWKNIEFPSNDSSSLTVYGYKSFYTKTISIQDNVITPTINDRYTIMLKDSALKKTIKEHKFAYVENAITTLLKFSPSSFSFLIDNREPTVFHIIQQYNSNWKATVNGHAIPVTPDSVAFMKIMIGKGPNRVDLVYRPTAVIAAAYISLIIFLACIAWLIYSKWTKK